MRGDRLKLIREQRGMSQRDLAAQLGMGEKQIWRYENETNDATAEQLARIAKLLEVTADYLIGLVDDPHQHLTEEDLSPMEREMLSRFRNGDFMKVIAMITGEAMAQPPEQRHVAADNP